MGSYTRVVVRVTIRKDTPSAYIEMLQLLTGVCSDAVDKRIDELLATFVSPHPFFTAKHGRDSFFHDFVAVGDLKCYSKFEVRTVESLSRIKNYESVVDHFANWIKPWLDPEEPQFIGHVSDERDAMIMDTEYTKIAFRRVLPTVERYPVPFYDEAEVGDYIKAVDAAQPLRY